MLFELRNVLAKPLAELFRLSIDSGCIPQDFRDAIVTPIFKKGSKSKVENYRPVSLTSIVGKMLESIIKEQIVNFVDSNNLIRDSQHGFTSGRSCLTNLLDFFETVTREIDLGNNVDLIYLDFAKAFDKVPHLRLVAKLKAHGISGRLLQWITNWLCDRRQRVNIEGEYFIWSRVSSGVPQGSVLGPILFFFYINDIDAEIISKLSKFADDTKTGKVVNSTRDADELRADLRKLEEWSSKWLMPFNTEKCKVLHLGKNNACHEYSLNGMVMNTVEKEKDLGIIIDKSLKFSEHCNSVASSANSIVGMIKRSITCRSKHIIVKLYKALVRPKLEYCVQAWRPFLKRDIEILERVQARATRLISECKNQSYSDRLKTAGLPLLEERRDRGDLIEVFKILKGFTKVDYRKWFKLSPERRTTGHRYKLIKTGCKKDTRKYFFSQRVINQWNQLPEDVVEATSVNMFKNRLDKLRTD